MCFVPGSMDSVLLQYQRKAADVRHRSQLHTSHPRKPVPAQQSFLVLIKKMEAKSDQICLDLCICPAVNKSSLCFQNVKQNLGGYQFAFAVAGL